MTTTPPPGLPVDAELAAFIAGQAIDLFVETRDVHARDEDEAKRQAVRTVAEGASLDVKALGVDPADGPAEATREKPDLIGFLIVEPSSIPSEPPKADWDDEIHPTREQAEAECAQANGAGSEPDEEPDDWWRVVAVVEVDAIAEAEKRATDRAVAHLVQKGRIASRSWVTNQGSQIATALIGAAHDLGCGCEDSTVAHLQEWAQAVPSEPAEDGK